MSSAHWATRWPPFTSTMASEARSRTLTRASAGMSSAPTWSTAAGAPVRKSCARPARTRATGCARPATRASTIRSRPCSPTRRERNAGSDQGEARGRRRPPAARTLARTSPRLSPAGERPVPARHLERQHEGLIREQILPLLRAAPPCGGRKPPPPGRPHDHASRGGGAPRPSAGSKRLDLGSGVTSCGSTTARGRTDATVARPGRPLGRLADLHRRERA